MVEAKLQDYEQLIQKKVAGKVTDTHDYQDCCQECRIRVWQAFGKYGSDESNGMSLRNWMALQVDSAINNFLRDTYYTERAKREIPYGLLLDMELLFKERYEEPFEGRGALSERHRLEEDVPQDLFKRRVESDEREKAEFKELEEEILRNLKPMQVEIYKMLKQGYTQREIASSLDHGKVSQPYVHKQVSAIKKVVSRILRRRDFF